MGTWGYGTFESDEALEWADEFDKTDDPISFIEGALPENPYDLDELGGLHVLCAAEAIVAILTTQRTESRIFFPDPAPFEADAFRLKPRCLKLLRHILSQETGLRSLWFDKEDNPNEQWDAHLQSLIDDLEAA